MARDSLSQVGMTQVTWHNDAEEAVERAIEIEATNRRILHEACNGGAKRKKPPAFVSAYYPKFALKIEPKGRIANSVTHGAVYNGPGIYTHTASRVEFKRRYYNENLSALLRNYPGTRIALGLSNEPIPVEYELPQFDDTQQAELGTFARAGYTRVLKTAKERRNGFLLSPYDAPLFDYYWEALRHYTGTDPTKTQKYIVLFNYKKYEKTIITLGRKLARTAGSGYKALVIPDGYQSGSEWQMPAFHLVGDDDTNGITFVNIGVGAPNAVTATLALCAVARPEVVTMFGHVGGTGQGQAIGNVVIASGFATFCGASRYLVPEAAQISPIGEVQRAMKQALANIYKWENFTEHCQSGTLTSVDFRHWVVDPEWYSRILASMPAAVDMEGSEVARAAWASKTAYGFLGFISDIPPYDVPKLRGSARKFYEETRQKFIEVAIETCSLLRDESRNGRGTTRSRKIAPPYMPAGTTHHDCLIPYPFA
ncbi:MAG: hypothetical protein U0136_04760 [Bdellovibrionota bacterium]